jgi:hypothetical protein
MLQILSEARYEIYGINCNKGVVTGLACNLRRIVNNKYNF